MDIVKFAPPSGPEWELLVAVVVIIIGPVIVERFRLPGMVGLLFGGMVVGPNVLGVGHQPRGCRRPARRDRAPLPDVHGRAGPRPQRVRQGPRAGRRVRAPDVLRPVRAGVLIGTTVGYDVAAAVLLGAVFASHTLVTYPVLRSYGLSTNRAVAITVGATVITDTLALIVLAVVSGQASGDVSGFELAPSWRSA